MIKLGDYITTKETRYHNEHALPSTGSLIIGVETSHFVNGLAARVLCVSNNGWELNSYLDGYLRSDKYSFCENIKDFENKEVWWYDLREVQLIESVIVNFTKGLPTIINVIPNIKIGEIFKIKNTSWEIVEISGDKKEIWVE